MKIEENNYRKRRKRRRRLFWSTAIYPTTYLGSIHFTHFTQQ